MKLDFEALHIDPISKQWYIAGTAVAVVVLAARKLRKYRREMAIERAIDQLRMEREKQFDRLRRGLNNEGKEPILRKQIVAMPIKELINKLKSEELKPKDVLEAYQEAALEAQDKTNCICFFITESMIWAEQLWEIYHGKPKPPLYGLPFSVKESIEVKGYLSTRGYSHPVLHPEDYVGKRDAMLVAQLKALGAIPFCTTNVPQSLMSFVTSNPVYGPSRHPHSDFRDRNPGGSSGGEGAFIGAGGSLFGLGSDVAGSIRMPSHVSGIAGMKPTSFRLSKLGQVASVPGRTTAFASIGPMARDTDTIIIVLKAIWDNFSTSNAVVDGSNTVNEWGQPCLADNPELFDHFVPPIPFNNAVLFGGAGVTRKLRIGYYYDDEFFPAIPAVQRAVSLAKAVLEAKGHELVPIAPPDVWSAMKFITPAMYPDAGAYMRQQMEKGILDAYHKTHYAGYCIPLIFRRWLYAPIARIFWGIRPSMCYDGFAGNIYSLTEANAAASAFQASETKRFSEELGLDAWICPPNAGVATPHHVHIKTLLAASYTFIYNILNYPAGVVPVTRVTGKDDVALERDYPTSDALLRLAKIGNSQSKGLPVGVQCVSYPFQEEMVLRIMKEIEDKIGYD